MTLSGELNKELTRAFLCIEIDDVSNVPFVSAQNKGIHHVPGEAVKEVARIQDVLAGQKFIGKMTELENLHLTLKFLGEIDDSMIEKVKERLGKVEFSEFDVKFGKAGVFSIRGNPKIVWIKLEGKGIFELQKKIEDALIGLFKPEEKFMSHMTMARVRFIGNKSDFVSYVNNLGVKEVKWKVSKFYFKKSELKSPGPVYTNMGSFNAKEVT